MATFVALIILTLFCTVCAKMTKHKGEVKGQYEIYTCNECKVSQYTYKVR